MSEMTFIDRVLAGDVLEPEQEIENMVARWHRSDTELALHDWLGFTWPEYALWAEKPKFLRAILMARVSGMDLARLVVDDSPALAARGVSSHEVHEVREWLRRTGRI